MRSPRLKLFICLLGAALGTACGSPGIPLPPALELARPVTDLRAARKGNQVHLTWTLPTQTTDRRNLRHGGTVEVCRAAGTMNTCATAVARIPFEPPIRNKAANIGSYTDQLQAGLHSSSTSQFFYAVSVLNPYGRSAGLSNQVEIPAAPTLQAPSDFRAQLTGDGVQLSWNAVTAPEGTALRFIYRIYRRQEGSKADQIAGELAAENQPSPTLLDRSFEWEKTYDYRATVVTIAEANGTEQQVEGDDTPPVRVVAHDVFPPATPTGLQAVFSGPGQKAFIDLIWTPNSEADLAGYNVFRREPGSEWRKLNSDLVRSPAFRDEAVVAGQRYSYSVSAADVRGNESPRSEEASEKVPAQ